MLYTIYPILSPKICQGYIRTIFQEESTSIIRNNHEDKISMAVYLGIFYHQKPFWWNELQNDNISEHEKLVTLSSHRVPLIILYHWINVVYSNLGRMVIVKQRDEPRYHYPYWQNWQGLDFWAILGREECYNYPKTQIPCSESGYKECKEVHIISGYFYDDINPLNLPQVFKVNFVTNHCMAPMAKYQIKIWTQNQV